MPGYYSESFKDLVTGMIKFDPNQRYNLETVNNHPWLMEEPTATLEAA